MVVVDSSVLIVLAKIGRVNVLRQVFGGVLISPTVKIEVIDQGEAVSSVEVGRIRQAMRERWLRMARLSVSERKVMQGLRDRTTLGLGEAESIVLAQARQLSLVVDDKEARAVAHGMGLEYIGTGGALLEGFRSGFITLDEFDVAIRDLAKVLWVSPEVVVELLRRAREVKM